jgi:hypothetical protein
MRYTLTLTTGDKVSVTLTEKQLDKVLAAKWFTFDSGDCINMTYVVHIRPAGK